MLQYILSYGLREFLIANFIDSKISKVTLSTKQALMFGSILSPLLYLIEFLFTV